MMTRTRCAARDVRSAISLPSLCAQESNAPVRWTRSLRVAVPTQRVRAQAGGDSSNGGDGKKVRLLWTRAC
jgi:hypothetical protein